MDRIQVVPSYEHLAVLWLHLGNWVIVRQGRHGGTGQESRGSVVSQYFSNWNLHYSMKVEKNLVVLYTKVIDY